MNKEDSKIQPVQTLGHAKFHPHDFGKDSNFMKSILMMPPIKTKSNMDFQSMWFKLKDKVNNDYSLTREKVLGIIVEIEVEENRRL